MGRHEAVVQPVAGMLVGTALEAAGGQECV